MEEETGEGGGGGGGGGGGAGGSEFLCSVGMIDPAPELLMKEVWQGNTIHPGISGAEEEVMILATSSTGKCRGKRDR